MTDVTANEVSSLLKYLPATFQEGSRGNEPNFLARFLLGFEDVLLGRDVALEGFEQKIAAVHRYFEPGADLVEPERAPREFLQWLAGWVALTLRDDLDDEPQRRFIANAVQLYRRRGTKRGIVDFLNIFTEVGTSYIDERNDAFQIGVHSQIGVDTWVNGGPAFAFVVHIKLRPTTDLAVIEAKRAIACAIVDLQKPAHTSYTLEYDGAPRLQIGVSSTVGIDTIIF